eukprot:gene11289-12594_t
MSTTIDNEANAPMKETNSSSPIDKKSDNSSSPSPPGRSGTICSFFLILIGIVVSIIVYARGKDITMSSFDEGCPDDYLNSCRAVSGVLRVSFALTLLYAVQFFGTLLAPRFFDALWVIKYLAFSGLVIGLFFAPSSVFNTNNYAWFARITGFFYLILQQIILLDVAYTWNERWVSFATSEEGERGNLWLIGIVIISCVLFLGAFLVLAILYWQFHDCDNNIVIITLTVAFCLIATIIQLFFSEEGSILTSAIMTAYSAYITYSAVILNPDDTCNAALHSGYQTVSAIIGLCLTVLSILWTTYNTVKKIPQITDSSTGEAINIVNVGTTTSAKGENEIDLSLLRQLLAQVSLVFICVSGYYAMVLTNWATYQSSSDIYEARTGTSTMWIQASGQWIAIAFYLWSLVAPQILSNRDFS